MLQATTVKNEAAARPLQICVRLITGGRTHSTHDPYFLQTPFRLIDRGAECRPPLTVAAHYQVDGRAGHVVASDVQNPAITHVIGGRCIG